MKLQDSWDEGGAENFSEEGGKEDVFRTRNPKLSRLNRLLFCKRKKGKLSTIKRKKILKATRVYYRNVKKSKRSP